MNAYDNQALIIYSRGEPSSSRDSKLREPAQIRMALAIGRAATRANMSNSSHLSSNNLMGPSL